MGTPPEPSRDASRAASEAAAQRTAEQIALRNVRKQLDHLAAQDARQRKLNRIVAIIAVVVFLVLLFVVGRRVLSHKQDSDAPIQIPSKVDMGKKPAARPAEPAK